LNPFEYLRDVIDKVATHPQKRINELLPLAWGQAQAVAAGENAED
jgi:hypothetical protein